MGGSAAAVRNLAGQVRRSFTVSSLHFSQSDDRLALVTLRGTNTLLEHFVGLLDCARAAQSGDKFEQRLGKKGHISTTAVRYCGEVQNIIGELEGNAVRPVDIFSFLRVLHVLSFDLHSSTRQTEAHVKSMLALGEISDGVQFVDCLIRSASACLGARRLERCNEICKALTLHDDMRAQEMSHCIPVAGENRLNDRLVFVKRIGHARTYT